MGEVKKALSTVWFDVTGLEVATGEGCKVVTVDGVEYLDFAAGIAVASTGHCHPHVVEAIQRQAARFIHAQANNYRHDLMVPFAERLAEVTPPGIETFFYANSGAEATEAAVKLAKQVTGRPNIIVFQGSFHGRTHLTMAMTTSKTAYRAGYQPLPSGVFVAPFPSRVGRQDDLDPLIDDALERLRLLLLSQTAPAETAAMVIEPVLGEGGYLPAPRRFLEGVVALCRDHDILFVADEVQTGFGRTGTMFACEQYDIAPDVLVMAKGIASGFPISAIGASAELMARWPTGSHGGTYGGNPIGCAAALATIDVLTGPGFLEHVRARGDQLRAGLTEIQAKDAGLADVRGPGLMVAAEFVDAKTGLPDAPRVGAILRHCLDEGHLILMNAGTNGNVVRWMPPLVATEADINDALTSFRRAVTATA